MPMPLSNQYIDVMDDDMCLDDKFNPLYVNQILDSRNRIFDAMCRETGCTEYDQLRSYMFDSRNITKNMLSEWLETVCRILDAYAAPVLSVAVTEHETLKSEKIADQQRIIELQEKLIEKKESELDSVKREMQTTVQAEMKSYSSVLTTTCNKALAPKKVQAALKTAADEEDRSSNFIVFGIQEKKDEKLEEEITAVLSHLDEKPRIVSCSRLGRVRDDAEKGATTMNPIRVKLSGSDHVRQILLKKMRLRNVEGYKTVYISPDRSTEQRVAHKKLVEEMKRKRLTEPERNHYIRNNAVVTVDSGT